MSNIYTCTSTVGAAEVVILTDDVDFMEWYLTKDDVHYTEEKQPKKDLFPEQDRLKIMESFTGINKYAHSITLDINGNISLTSNGYTINGAVCREK